MFRRACMHAVFALSLLFLLSVSGVLAKGQDGTRTPSETTTPGPVEVDHVNSDDMEEAPPNGPNPDELGHEEVPSGPSNDTSDWPVMAADDQVVEDIPVPSSL